MIEALIRLNTAEKLSANIKAMCDNPQLRLVALDDTSEYKTQSTGRRQGFPLSPYLFILVTTVMFTDIHDKTNRKSRHQQPTKRRTRWSHLNGSPFITATARNRTRVRVLQHETNEDKWETILMNKKSKVRLRSGKIMKEAERALCQRHPRQKCEPNNRDNKVHIRYHTNS